MYMIMYLIFIVSNVYDYGFIVSNIYDYGFIVSKVFDLYEFIMSNVAGYIFNYMYIHIYIYIFTIYTGL